MDSKMLLGVVGLVVLLGLGWFFFFSGSDETPEEQDNDTNQEEQAEETGEMVEIDPPTTVIGGKLDVTRCLEVCNDAGNKSSEICDCQCDHLADNLETQQDMENVLDGWFDPDTYAQYQAEIDASITYSNSCGI